MAKLLNGGGGAQPEIQQSDRGQDQGSAGRPEAEPAHSLSRLGKKGWQPRELITPARSPEAGKLWVGWSRPSLLGPAHQPALATLSSGAQAPEDAGPEKGRALLTHQSPTSFSRALQVSGLWTWPLVRGGGAWRQRQGTPGSAKRQPPVLAGSEALCGRDMDPESSCRCPGLGGVSPVQDGPPGSSPHPGPVVASQATLD